MEMRKAVDTNMDCKNLEVMISDMTVVMSGQSVPHLPSPLDPEARLTRAIPPGRVKPLHPKPQTPSSTNSQLDKPLPLSDPNLHQYFDAALRRDYHEFYGIIMLGVLAYERLYFEHAHFLFWHSLYKKPLCHARTWILHIFKHTY